MPQTCFCRKRAQNPFLPRTASEWKNEFRDDAYTGDDYFLWFFVNHKSYEIDNKSKKEKSTKENISEETESPLVLNQDEITE